MPRPELRDRVLAAATPGGRYEGLVSRLATFLDLAPARVRELVGLVPRADLAPWVDDRVARVRLLHFEGGPRVASADCGIVRVAPGATYPRHHHRGDEWALVLEGSAKEDSGRVWGPGDLVHNPAGSAHSFRALGPGPFVFAAELHEGLEFESGDHLS